MKTMRYDSEKGRLKANFRIEGLIAAFYAFNYYKAVLLLKVLKAITY